MPTLVTLDGAVQPYVTAAMPAAPIAEVGGDPEEPTASAPGGRVVGRRDRTVRNSTAREEMPAPQRTVKAPGPRSTVTGAQRGELGATLNPRGKDRQKAVDDRASRLACLAYGQAGVAAPRRPVLLARDLMQSPVRTLPPEAPLGDAWSLMMGQRFRHLPIAAPDGRLIGILSDRDLLRYAAVLEHGGSAASHAYPIREVMTAKVFTATSDTGIHEIARMMLEQRVSALPIVDDGHRPIGILTVTDILRGVVTRAPLELWT